MNRIVERVFESIDGLLEIEEEYNLHKNIRKEVFLK